MSLLNIYFFAFIVLVSGIIILYNNFLGKKCPSRVNDGFADWPESEEGKVTSKCYEGYASESVPYRTCANGQWSEISFKCYPQHSPRKLQGDCMIIKIFYDNRATNL